MTLSPASYQFLLPRPQISLSTTFSNTLSLFSSLNAQHQASWPYEVLKLIFLGVLTSTLFLNKNYTQITVNVKQSRNRPGVAQRVPGS
jgi:hypothetical protein